MPFKSFKQQQQVNKYSSQRRKKAKKSSILSIQLKVFRLCFFSQTPFQFNIRINYQKFQQFLRLLICQKQILLQTNFDNSIIVNILLLGQRFYNQISQIRGLIFFIRLFELVTQVIRLLAKEQKNLNTLTDSIIFYQIFISILNVALALRYIHFYSTQLHTINDQIYQLNAKLSLKDEQIISCFNKLFERKKLSIINSDKFTSKNSEILKAESKHIEIMIKLKLLNEVQSRLNDKYDQINIVKYINFKYMSQQEKSEAKEQHKEENTNEQQQFQKQNEREINEDNKEETNEMKNIEQNQSQKNKVEKTKQEENNQKLEAQISDEKQKTVPLQQKNNQDQNYAKNTQKMQQAESQEPQNKDESQQIQNQNKIQSKQRIEVEEQYEKQSKKQSNQAPKAQESISKMQIKEKQADLSQSAKQSEIKQPNESENRQQKQQPNGSQSIEEGEQMNVPKVNQQKVLQLTQAQQKPSQVKANQPQINQLPQQAKKLSQCESKQQIQQPKACQPQSAQQIQQILKFNQLQSKQKPKQAQKQEKAKEEQGKSKRIQDCVLQGINVEQDDMFSTSKLFTSALSSQTSHYIQSKMMSLPKQSQDLKKLDLRHMCQTVVHELQVVQKQAAYDYIQVSSELQTMGKELTTADNIMQQLQNVLNNFKDHLQTIKNQMTSLQQKSNKMNTSLSNKKKVQNLLNNFIQSAVLDKNLIDAICLGQINQDYVIHIKNLLKKLSYLNSNSISPDSKAVKQLQPELQKLKLKASIRLREFMLGQIQQLKKQKSNINIIQKNVLSKYKVFMEFFKQQFPTIFTELCNSYRQILAKFYLGNYKIYLQQIHKIQIEIYRKNDALLPNDPQYYRQFANQIKPTNLNQEKKSIFFLMNRDKIVDTKEANDVILYSAAQQSGQKYTIEQIFKSVNRALMDGVLNEITFTAQFFNMKSEGAIELFGPIFRPTLNTFVDNLKSTISNTYDIFGVLLIIAINERNRLTFAQRNFSALDYYFDQISMVLWPKFQQLFDWHCKNLIGISIQNYKKIEKLISTKTLLQRFGDFIASFYRMYYYFQSQMIGIRLQTVKKHYFELMRRVSKDYERQVDNITYYINSVQQVYSSLIVDKVISQIPQFQEEKVKLQIEINQYAQRIASMNMRDLFPSIDFITKKHAKEEGNMGQDSNISIQGPLEQKVISQYVNETNIKNVSSKLDKLIIYSQKNFTGYTLKTVLRRFNKTFMKYYNEIYKHLKSNHNLPIINTLLQPHNMMKQINHAFQKHCS